MRHTYSHVIGKSASFLAVQTLSTWVDFFSSTHLSFYEDYEPHPRPHKLQTPSNGDKLTSAVEYLAVRVSWKSVRKKGICHEYSAETSSTTSPIGRSIYLNWLCLAFKNKHLTFCSTLSHYIKHNLCLLSLWNELVISWLRCSDWLYRLAFPKELLNISYFLPVVKNMTERIISLSLGYRAWLEFKSVTRI